MLSPIPFCLIAAYLVGMFNSTICGTARWSLPHYFEYDIVNGLANVATSRRLHLGTDSG